MAIYEYKGRSHNNELIKGQIEAVNAENVVAHLTKINVTPIDISLAGQDWNGDLLTPFKRFFQEKVKLDDLAFFCRQMHTLLKAGVSIMESLQGLQGSASNKVLDKVIGKIRDSLDAGMDLSTSIRHHPDVFSGLFVGIIQAGEQTGDLAGSFQQLSVYLEKEREFRQKISSAMRYPIIVIVALVIAMLIVNVFVIPAFASTYEHLGTNLPLMTQLLIAVSNLTVNYWHALSGAFIMIAIGIKMALNTPQGHYLWHKHKLGLPVLGDILFHATLGRFSSTLAIAIRAGLPWGEGLGLVSNTVGNAFISEHVLHMREDVERGQSITASAMSTQLFPPLVLQMFRVGEQAGAMENMLQEIADYYESESNYKLKNISTLIEPILIAVLSGLVMILALGIFLPMWDLGKAAI